MTLTLNPVIPEEMRCALRRASINQLMLYMSEEQLKTIEEYVGGMRPGSKPDGVVRVLRQSR